MAKRRKRKRTTSEKIFLALSILIAISMILTLFVGFASSGRSGNAPLPVESLMAPAAILASLIG